LTKAVVLAAIGSVVLSACADSPATTTATTSAGASGSAAPATLSVSDTGTFKGLVTSSDVITPTVDGGKVTINLGGQSVTVDKDKKLKVGFFVRYVPVLVSKGLCPDTLSGFVNQQYRWCTGSMSLLLSRGFHKAPLTRIQRLCFWSGFLYYIDTAINVFVVSLPPILMAVLAPEAVSVNNYLFVFLALIVRMSIVPVVTMGSESMTGLTRIQSTYSFAHALALFDAIRGRTDAWQATGVKGGTPTARRVRRLVMTWCVVVQVLMWATCLWRAPVYGWFNFLPMMGFAVLNLAITYPIILWRAGFPKWLDPMMPRRKLAGLHA